MVSSIRFTRRDFLKVCSATSLGFIVPTSYGLSTRVYQGTNFAGWETVVGDGVYSAPGEPPVNLNDIQTVHYSTYSELRANIQRRRIMAHNIAFKRVIDDLALQYIHICGFKFRLPYVPSTDNFELNAQTLEGGLFVWDGRGTRLDYGLGFQWLLNPWMTNFGEMRAWRDIGGGQWESVGYLKPDTKWHEIRIAVDFRRETTSLKIDGIRYPSCFTATPRPEHWGTEIAARFQAEIINVYPEPSGICAMHKAEFKDWTWTWESQGSCQVFLPYLRK
ncbi:MAG: hypothetical protein QXT77_08660 [Candidatus Methanomethylicaceae archaeon]